MFFAGGVFKVDRQTGLEWVFAILIGLGAMPVAVITKWLSK